MTELLGGRYELRGRIGTGAMAEVSEAYDRKLDRTVAVKILRGGVPDIRARERFEREARVAAGFLHPNAVTVFDVGEDGDRPYIVMELVDGSSLADLLAARGPLEPEEAASIADQILAALGAAHERGLVHRDVKPGNVLVARDSSAKLADFGIAKALSDATAGLTGTGQVMGTPKYFAPEQVSGAGATPRSDLYSLGVVLYEMLAGAPPFEADSAVGFALAHQQAPVPPLVERCPGVPHALAAAVERALEKDPARRFADAPAMRQALSRAVASSTDQTVPAAVASAPTATQAMPTETSSSRPPWRARRQPRWALLVASLAIALGVIALISALTDESAIDTPSATATPSAANTSATTTAPPETSPPQPATLEELIALLGADPDAFGERGNDLLGSLRDIIEDPADQGEKAADTIADIEKWIAAGQLDPDIGALAATLLAPLATEQGGGPPETAGGNRGNGGDRKGSD